MTHSTPQLLSSTTQTFQNKIIDWQKRHGRNTLPWQAPYDRYRVWVSEVMLQQTQVQTVIPYFNTFVQRFPNLRSLGKASLDDVLTLWQGLGYYRRAKHLWQAAKTLTEQDHDTLPASKEALYALPGIGKSTAHAILSLADAQPLAILDANVKRVLVRFFALPEDIRLPKTEKALWRLADSLITSQNPRRYNQGLMDLGAQICSAKHPKCSTCPLNTQCLAFAHNLTQSLPYSSKRKPKPKKNTYALLYTSHNAVLLEKRSPGGIWPSLWSLPMDADINALAKRFCKSPLALTPLQSISHTFTHYHLSITPLHSSCAHQTPLREGLCWVKREDLATYALPAPIAKFFASFNWNASSSTSTCQ